MLCRWVIFFCELGLNVGSGTTLNFALCKKFCTYAFKSVLISLLLGYNWQVSLLWGVFALILYFVKYVRDICAVSSCCKDGNRFKCYSLLIDMLITWLTPLEFLKVITQDYAFLNWCVSKTVFQRIELKNISFLLHFLLSLIFYITLINFISHFLSSYFETN